MSDVVLDTEAQSQVANVALLIGEGGPPNENEVPRPYLTPLDVRLAALRPRFPQTTGSPAEPAPVPRPPELPLPTFAPQRHLATAKVDRRGLVRLDDALTVLGWAPGTRLSCTLEGNEATLRRAETGSLVLGSDGRVTLQRVALYALRVEPGRRAAVETDDDHDEVRIFSPSRLVRL